MLQGWVTGSSWDTCAASPEKVVSLVLRARGREAGVKPWAATFSTSSPYRLSILQSLSPPSPNFTGQLPVLFQNPQTPLALTLQAPSLNSNYSVISFLSAGSLHQSPALTLSFRVVQRKLLNPIRPHFLHLQNEVISEDDEEVR